MLSKWMFCYLSFSQFQRKMKVTYYQNFHYAAAILVSDLEENFQDSKAFLGFLQSRMVKTQMQQGLEITPRCQEESS